MGSRIIPKKHRNKGYLQPENYTSIIGVCCLKSGQCAGLRVFAAWAKAATSSAAYLAAGAVKEESWPTISLDLIDDFTTGKCSAIKVPWPPIVFFFRFIHIGDTIDKIELRSL